MTMSPTLAQHRADLETMIVLNERADVPRYVRLALDELTDQGRKFLRVIDRAVKDQGCGFSRGSLVMLSIHGGEPAIRDIVKQAERFRAMAAVAKPIKRRIAA